MSNGDQTVEIVEFLYEPEDLTVAAGTTITWVNEDKATHTATAADGSFDTGRLEQGEEGEVTLTDPGTYEYVCGFHAFMRASVMVE